VDNIHPTQDGEYMGEVFLNASYPRVKEKRLHIIDEARIEQGLDYLLTHFEEPIWPRTISTRTTQGRQIVVFNRMEAFVRFKQANGLDCRINAYPNYVEWKGMNRQAPNFVFIDLDSNDIDLKKILEGICAKFDDYSILPTVLLSGNGYHIYLPVTAFIFELEEFFSDFDYPSRKFLQWAEKHLSDNKADPCHTQGLSFKNCMLRVPGSINSKVDREVEVIQRWNGIRPSIKPLLEEFYIDITEDKINEISVNKVDAKLRYSNKVFKYWNCNKQS